MRIALLAPIAWRTPPLNYGPWERVVSLLCEGLAERGVDVSAIAPALKLPCVRSTWQDFVGSAPCCVNILPSQSAGTLPGEPAAAIAESASRIR